MPVFLYDYSDEFESLVMWYSFGPVIYAERNHFMYFFRKLQIIQTTKLAYKQFNVYDFWEF